MEKVFAESYLHHFCGFDGNCNSLCWGLSRPCTCKVSALPLDTEVLILIGSMEVFVVFPGEHWAKGSLLVVKENLLLFSFPFSSFSTCYYPYTFLLSTWKLLLFLVADSGDSLTLLAGQWKEWNATWPVLSYTRELRKEQRYGTDSSVSLVLMEQTGLPQFTTILWYLGVLVSWWVVEHLVFCGIHAINDP
jgi:hypothetical protein